MALKACLKPTRLRERSSIYAHEISDPTRFKTPLDDLHPAPASSGSGVGSTQCITPDGGLVGFDETIVAGIACLFWWNFVNVVRSRMELGTRGQHVLASSLCIETIGTCTSRDSINADLERVGLIGQVWSRVRTTDRTSRSRLRRAQTRYSGHT